MPVYFYATVSRGSNNSPSFIDSFATNVTFDLCMAEGARSAVFYVDGLKANSYLYFTAAEKYQ